MADDRRIELLRRRKQLLEQKRDALTRQSEFPTQAEDKDPGFFESGGTASKVGRGVASLGVGIQQDPIFGAPQRLASGITKGIFGRDPVGELGQELAKESPITTAIGSQLPGLARSVGGFTAGMGAIPTIAKGTSALSRVGKPLIDIGRTAVSSVIGGQADKPGIERIPTDAAIGAMFGTLAEAGSAVSPPLRRQAAKLYSSVLKRPTKRILAEAKQSGQTLEDFLADRLLFTPTVKGLQRTAGKNIKRLSGKINELIKPIKLKVNPGKMVDELQGLKAEFNLVDDIGRPVPGETGNIKIIDDMIAEIDKNFMRNSFGQRISHLSIQDAQKLKQSLWKRAKKAFEQTEAAATKAEAQAAAGRGVKVGIEEAAEGTGTGLGKKLSALNREEGKWLEAAKAAGSAEARIGKTFFGRLVMPLVFGGGAAASAGFGSEGAAVPLAAAAVLSSPGGRLAVANTLGAIAKTGNYPELVRALTPIVSKIVSSSDKNGGK